MNCIFNSLFKPKVPILNSHKIIALKQISFNSFHSSTEHYFRPNLIQLKQGSDQSTKSSKSQKTVIFRNKIEQHDLQSKLNNIQKWLGKSQQVKTVIQHFGDPEKSEILYRLLVKELDGKGVFEKRSVSPRDISFVISPTTESEETESP